MSVSQIGSSAHMRFFEYTGQVDLESSADAGFTVHPDVTSALLHHAIDRGQAEASALSLGFGCEEGLENVTLRCGIHSHARIRYSKQDVIPRRHGRTRAQLIASHIR